MKRTLLLVTLTFFTALPAPARDNDARIKTVVEGRYREWIAAANKRDAEALSNLYDEDAVLMPKQEEPVVGRAAIAAYYKKLVADPHFVPVHGSVRIEQLLRGGRHRDRHDGFRRRADQERQ